eukprot:403352899
MVDQPSEVPSMTADELKKFDGVHDEKVYLALKNNVYDVTGADFYKPGGAYHCFAGRDASVGLAKMSKDEQFSDRSQFKWNECLDQKEIEVLQQWIDRLSAKYPLVATLAE